MIANCFISFMKCENFIRERFRAPKYWQSCYDCTYQEIGYLKCRESQAKKLNFRKNVQICTNCYTLSNHNNLFFISAGILMTLSFFFVRLFSIQNTFWVVNKLEIFSRDFRQGIILPSNIILGVQLKFYCRKRIQENKLTRR